MGGGPNTEEEYPSAQGEHRTAAKIRIPPLSLDGSTRSIPEEELSSDSPMLKSNSVISMYDSADLPLPESPDTTVDEGCFGDDGTMTPGTDVSSLTPRLNKEKFQKVSSLSRSISAGKTRPSSTIAEFRENQMRCMQALKKGARAAAVVHAMRQTSEPVRYSTPMGGMSKQVSEESSLTDTFNERYSDIIGVAPQNGAVDHLVADPLVAVVKGLTQQQNQNYKQLLDSLGDVRQATFVHRQEIKDILKKHGQEIEALKEKKKGSKFLSVLKTFAAAFGVAVGVSNAHGVITKVFEAGAQRCPINLGLSGFKPVEAATFVLPPRAGAAGGRSAAAKPRRTRRSSTRQ